MPNGRSGGFRITKAGLGAILEAHPSTVQIAKGRLTGGTVAEVLDALAAFPDDEFNIEQHDGSWYIVWLDPTSERGDQDLSEHLAFIVDEESPIFHELVDRHRQWTESLEDPSTTDGPRRRLVWLIVISLMLGGLVLLVVLM